ncbi:response regulator [Falsiroseomonas sp. CW058]|uniref:response regulator n=1 Tax=Falsiroseomonas sp. CW058 TaxID=3388664 RepID=UPI003D31A393
MSVRKDGVGDGAGEARAGAADGSGPALPEGLTVLFAEDDLHIAEAVQDYLEDFGCRVLHAADGLIALGMVQAGCSFDVLLTDLCMPRLDGERLIRRVATLRPRTPVVVLSGSLPPRAATRLRPPPGAAIALLEKPARSGEIMAAIMAVLPRPFLAAPTELAAM